MKKNRVKNSLFIRTFDVFLMKAHKEKSQFFTARHAQNTIQHGAFFLCELILLYFLKESILCTSQRGWLSMLLSANVILCIFLPLMIGFPLTSSLIFKLSYCLRQLFLFSGSSPISTSSFSSLNLLSQASYSSNSITLVANLNDCWSLLVGETVISCIFLDVQLSMLVCFDSIVCTVAMLQKNSSSLY